VVTGSPGTAEAGALVRVRVVRTAADTTKLADDDGGFRLEVPALISDTLKLYLKDNAGNETEVIVPPFANPDGRTVVGAAGGVVAAANGAFAQIEPGALPDGAIVAIRPITVTDLPIAQPDLADFVAGVQFSVSQTPTQYIDLGVPAPPDARADDIVLVMRPVTLTNGAVTWTLVDRAHLEEGKYVTASPPFPGVLGSAQYSFFRPTYIIEPGPDGILQTQPDPVISDDEIEQRPTLNGTMDVVAPGPDGKLQMLPRFNSDDVRRTECMSFVTLNASYSLDVMFFSPTFPGIVYPVAGVDKITMAGYCNQPLDVQVSNARTGQLLQAISVAAPAERNGIIEGQANLTDDHEPPTVIGTILPTDFTQQQPEIWVKFSETMRAASLPDNFKVFDSLGNRVQGAVEILYNNTVAVFRPTVAFGLGQEYRIDLSGMEDFATNDLAAEPITFRRAAPQVLANLAGDQALFDALARCRNAGELSSCYLGPQDAVAVGKTVFLANGVQDNREVYLDNVTQRRLAVLDASDPTAPRLIGWYRTVTKPKSLAVVPDAAFNYIDHNGAAARFEGDLLVVIGGGKGGQDSARLELYDVTACFQRAAGENCLDESLAPFLGAKFLSTGMQDVQRIGVPAEPGSAAEIALLHDRVMAQDGDERDDTLMAYVVVVPVGIAAVDITAAVNHAHTNTSRYAIDGLMRGDFFDVAVIDNLVVAPEMPGSGISKLRVFGASLLQAEEIPIPRGFRLAGLEGFVVDLDSDGNLGAGEDGDNDLLEGKDEIFDLAVVASGGRQTTNGRGELYVIDLSKQSSVRHAAPLEENDNLADYHPRIVSRIPLPGAALNLCVNGATGLAYVAMDQVGVGIVDLNHLVAAAQNKVNARWLIDDNGDFVDDRLLYTIRSPGDPQEWLNGVDCQEGLQAVAGGEPVPPAYQPAAPGTLVLSWEASGGQLLGNFAVTAESPVIVRSDLDTINQTVCQAPELLRFVLSHPATVTVTIDGQAMLVDKDFVEAENDGVDDGLIPFASLPLAAGPHAYVIPYAAIAETGEHDFAVNAVFLAGEPGVTLSADGVIRHDLSMKANLPLAHTMVKGVDLWDGHLAHGAQDLALPGRGLGLEFSRTYGSGGVQTDGPLGAGWTHNYNVRLFKDNCGRYVVVGGEGSGNAFTNPHMDPARAALFASPTFTVAADALFYDPQIGYHSTLIRDGGNANRFDFFTPTHTRYHFERENDLRGEVYTLRFIEDSNGNRVTLDYKIGDTDATTLDRVTNASGYTIDFTYRRVASEPRIARLSADVGDPDLGVTVEYEYDTLGNLTVVTRTSPYAGFGLNDVRVNRYSYTTDNPEDPYNLRSVTDPDGNVTEYVYYAPADAMAGYTVDFQIAKHEFIKEIRQPEGVTTRFVYTISMNPAVPNQRLVSDPRPGVPGTLYTLNSYGAAVRVDAPLGRTTRTVWCTDLPLPAECARRDALKGAEIDALGRRTVYGYDALGNVVTETVRIDTVAAAHIQPTVDKNGQAVTRLTTTALYDPLFSKPVRTTDAEGNSTWFCLDSPTPQPAGSPCQPTAGRTGNLLAQVDALGHRTSYSYDAHGNLLSETDARGNTTSYLDHNSLGLPQRVIDPLGNVTQNVYDARGRLLETWDSFGRHATYAYDGLDRRIEERRLDDRGENGSAQVVRTLYSHGGQVIRTVNGLNHVSEHLYDGLGRLVQSFERDVLQADGTTVTYSTTLAYDEASNQVRETNARGITRASTYDALNRLVKRELVRGGGTVTLQSITYDAAGNKLTETDRHGYTHEYQYDGLYRVVVELLPFQHSYADTPVQRAQIQRRYDLAGNIVRQTDANGAATSMAYDKLYRLEQVTDPLGGQVVYTYDATGARLTEDELVTGVKRVYTYDALNRLLTLTLTAPFAGEEQAAATYVTAYAYDDADNAVTITDANGVKHRADKDGLDRLYQETADVDGLNLTTTYFYDGAGNLVQTQDAQGGDIDVAYTFDGLGRKLTAVFAATPDDIGPVEQRYFYDASSNLVRSIDVRGIERRYTYDDLERPLTQVLVESITNGGQPLLLEETVYADVAGADGLYRVTTFDSIRSRRVTWFDALDRAVRVEDGAGATLTGVTYRYDGVNLRERIDKNGLRTVYSYDAANRQVRVQEFDAAGVERSQIRAQFDDANLRTLTTDRRGIVTVEQRDGLGRLVQTSRRGLDMAAHYGAAEVVLAQALYDGVGNLLAATDANGNVTAYTYDGLNRVLTKTEGAGSPVAATTTWTYDAVGNVLTVKDGRAHGGAFDVQHTYDARYRRVRTENAAGEAATYRYDAANNVVRSQEPNGPAFATEYRYDELGALLAVDEQPRNDAHTVAGVTRYFYDAARNRIAQQDAAGNLVTYRYDAQGRLTDVYQHTVAGSLTDASQRGADPTGATLLASLGSQATALRWQYGYDAAGNKTLIVDPRGQRVVQGYDYLNRLAAKSYQNHAAPNLEFQPQGLVYVYDGNNNVVTITETKRISGAVASEVAAFTYDPLDRVRSRSRRDHDNPAGKTLRYVYDRAGNLTRLTDADNVATDYVYDARNRLVTVTTPAGVTRYTWWEDGLPKSVVYPNNTLRDLGAADSYDRADRLRKVLNGPNLAAAPFSTYAYTYDANGNRLTQVEAQRDLDGGRPITTTYAYDNLNRVISVDYGARGQVEYTYAANGNRLSETGIDPLSGEPLDRSYIYAALPDKPGVTFDGVNTLTRVVDNNDASRTVTYEYDRNLNMTARRQGAAASTFTFDIRDQIVAAVTPGGRVTFDYDFARMRVKKVAAAGETRYLYDASAVVMEYGGAGEGFASQAKYDYGYRLLSLTEIDGATRASRFYLVDGLGSTANLTDEAGDLVQSLRYDAWGRTLDKIGPAQNPRQFTGHYFDAETGLHYFGARYYDAEIGRFLSQDPYMGEANTPPSLHRYLYGYANPLRFVDSTGYASEDVSGGLTTEMQFSGQSSSVRRGGYFSMTATGSKAQALGMAEWLNVENKAEPMGAAAEVKFSGSHPASWAYAADAWAKETIKGLENDVQESPGMLNVLYATTVATGAELVSGFADSLRFGEGLAEWWETGNTMALFQDIFRGVDIATTLAGAPGGVSKFARRTAKMWDSLGNLGEAGWYTLARSVKRVGQEYAPVAMANQRALSAYQAVAKDRYVFGTRAVDPLTRWNANRLAEAGYMPKDTSVRAKTVAGKAVKEVEIAPGVVEHQIIHGDDDFAWVYDKQRGRYLTDDEFQVEIRGPVNKLLPPSYHLQHGPHNTLATYYMRKYKGDMAAVTKDTVNIGAVGPVVEMEWDAQGRLITKKFNADEARERFMNYKQAGWFWNPGWDATKSFAAEAGLADLAKATGRAIWDTAPMAGYLTPPMRGAPARAAGMYINAINGVNVGEK
jgi:RHS repeat-associated protein